MPSTLAADTPKQPLEMMGQSLTVVEPMHFLIRTVAARKRE
jgi:hypothetical protein